MQSLNTLILIMEWSWFFHFLLSVTAGKGLTSTTLGRRQGLRDDNGILYAFLSTCIQSQVQLQESAPELLRPEASVKLYCKTSAYIFSSNYMSWVKKKHGLGLEWIGHIDPD